MVEPDNISDIFIEDGKDYVTLVTCTPYGINSHPASGTGNQGSVCGNRKRTADQSTGGKYLESGIPSCNYCWRGYGPLLALALCWY